MNSKDLKTTLRFEADITAFQSSMETAKRSIDDANAGFKLATASMDNWRKNTDGLTAKIEQLTAVQAEEEKKLETIEAQYRKVAAEMGENSEEARIWATELTKQKAAVLKTENQIEKYSDELSRMEKNADSAADDVKDVGDAAKQSGEDAEKGAEGWTIIKDVIADFVKNTISWAVDSFKELMTAGDNALATLGARTGATTEQMSQYQDIMNDIYRSNYGESFDDVAEAMGVVIQTFDDLDSASLQNITQKAIALRDTFGFDYQETMRAVNSMMKQFGITADEAYNLIVQGAQNGLNQNGDLLDTINEYSVQFSSAGYSADQMFNMLANGAESGTWSVDKLGDAVKEFNIRAKDGTISDALVEYQKQLKLTDKDVAYLNTLMEQGGESGQKAYNIILERLGAVSDDTAKYQAGVALFGTMWEDLGETTVQSLMKTEGSIDSTKAAMEDLTNTKYDTLTSALQGLGRVVQVDILQPIADTLAPVVKSLIEWVIDNMPTLAPIIAAVASAIGVLAAALAIQGLISSVSKAFAALNAVMAANPFVLVASLIAALVAAFVVLWNKSDAFRNFWLNMWEGIKTAFASTVNWLKNAASSIAQYFSDAWNKIKTVWSNSLISKYFNAIWNTIKGIFSVVKSVLSGNFSGAWEAIKKIFAGWGNYFSGLWSKVVSVFSGVGSWFGNIFRSAWNSIANAFSSVGSYFAGVWNTIKSAFSIDGMLSIGKNLVQGLWNGISNSLQWIKNKISGWVDNVLDFIKDLFGIHSPSTETEWQGEQLVAGYVKALQNGRREMASAMQDFVKSGLGAVDVKPTDSLPGNTAGKTIIFNQTNNSPRALSRREIYRQTHNALAHAGGV